MREEEVARQFGLAIGAIRMDEEVLGWVIAALKESHADEMKFHADCMETLQNKYSKLARRLDALYEDKLDGNIDQDFFSRKSGEWKKELNAIQQKMERHQSAGWSYIDEGVKLLELAQRAVVLYEKQTDQEKRRVINFLCSNSFWKDGKLVPNYRQPFDILVKSNVAHKKEMALFPKKKGHFDIWLPGRDSNPRQGG